MFFLETNETWTHFDIMKIFLHTSNGYSGKNAWKLKILLTYWNIRSKTIAIFFHNSIGQYIHMYIRTHWHLSTNDGHIARTNEKKKPPIFNMSVCPIYSNFCKVISARWGTYARLWKNCHIIAPSLEAQALPCLCTTLYLY